MHSLVRFYFLVVLVAFLIVTNASLDSKYLVDNYPAGVLEDARLDTAQLLRKYKYPEETHFVTTSDQYILRMHRIPQPNGRPVLLMHGLLDSSATWILMGPWSGLGYYLHDLGYDVWMGNARGNRYSRNHTTLNPDTDKSYWKFSWHEIGMHDLPAMIDHVLSSTGHSQLHYFGHSQGTTSFWVLCSMRPEYNEKISIMHALAPVAFMKNIKSPMWKTMEKLILLSKERELEIMPHSTILMTNCFRSKLTVDSCMEMFRQFFGWDPNQFNMTMLPVVYGHEPAGCNLQQLEHYYQLIISDRFCQFDYEDSENERLYGADSPPDYPLLKITAPIALHYARNDYLSSDIDVQRLAKLLPNVVDDELYPDKNWGHVSMLWGIDARKLAHEHMVKELRKYE